MKSVYKIGGMPNNAGTGLANSASLNTKAVGDITDLALNYANGPLRAGVSYYTVSAVTAVASPAAGSAMTLAATSAAGANKQVNAYAQYDIAGATLYAGYHTETTDAAPGAAAGTAKSIDAKGYNVAFKYALTPSINLLGNYGQLTDNLAAKQDKKVSAIGAQYVLSKNTSLYARYIDESYSKVSTTAAADGSYGVTGLKSTMVGMQTNF